MWDGHSRPRTTDPGNQRAPRWRCVSHELRKPAVRRMMGAPVCSPSWATGITSTGTRSSATVRAPAIHAESVIACIADSCRWLCMIMVVCAGCQPASGDPRSRCVKKMWPWLAQPPPHWTLASRSTIYSGSLHRYPKPEGVGLLGTATPVHTIQSKCVWRPCCKILII